MIDKSSDERCVGCIYNVPVKMGGEGWLCNGITMTQNNRCPEWVINAYRKTLKFKQPFVMSELVESLKL